MTRPIYMDHQTTTPIDRDVLEAMMPYLTDQFGDPSSRSHAWGWAAEEAVDRARDQVATLIGAQPEEIFTSGATESDNLAIKGIARAYKEQGRHIVTQQTEHRAILDSCRTWNKKGLRSPICRWTVWAWSTLTRCGSDHRADNPGQHHARE